MERFATSQITRVFEETSPLFIKQTLKQGAALAAMIIVASALGYANRVDPADSDPPLVSHRSQTEMVDYRAFPSEQVVEFRTTLQGAHKNDAQILMKMANSSRSPEIAKEQESTTVLPESGTGLLLTIGLLAAIGTARKLDRRKCMEINARQMAMAARHKEAAPDSPPNSPRPPTWLEFGPYRYPAS